MNDNGFNALFRVTGTANFEPREVTITPQGFMIGRASESDLALNHNQISRQHARIFWDDGQYWIEDLNSSNGAWVNDSRIRPRAPQQLRAGDMIRLGPFLINFVKMLKPDIPMPTDPMFRQTSEAWVTPVPALRDGETETQDGMSIKQVLGEHDTKAGQSINDGVTKAPLSNRKKDTPPPAEPPSQITTDDEGDYPAGIPRYRSSWLEYLPSIYSDDEFLGRYLLIFESILSPIIWSVDNFDMYLTPDVAPPEWLRWMAGWFDLLLVNDLPVERQRAVMRQIGWLFLRRGTRVGLERLLALYFGVRPEIIENPDDEDSCHFVVRLPLSESNTRMGREIAERLIASQKPAFASHLLEIT